LRQYQYSVFDLGRHAGLATWRTSTEHMRTADQYFVWLSTADEPARGIDADITDVDHLLTVPRVVFNLRVLCDRYFNCRPLVVGKPECLLPVPRAWMKGCAPAPTGWPTRRALLTVRRRCGGGGFRHGHEFRCGRS
jgi:hypothetical protein